MKTSKILGMGLVALVVAVTLSLVMIPTPAQSSGAAPGKFALQCEGAMEGEGALKCKFWIDGIKVTQTPVGGTLKKVDPGSHQLEAQAFYRTGSDRDAKWVKAPTGKKSREVKVKAGETKDVVFDFGTVRP